MHHVFKLKNNRQNNRDLNIDPNNRDYDFFFSIIEQPYTLGQGAFGDIKLRLRLCFGQPFVHFQLSLFTGLCSQGGGLLLVLFLICFHQQPAAP